MIVSVTGLRTKGPLSTIRFWLLAIPAYRQAKRARGNLAVQIKTIDGVRHTLTAWKDRKHMKHYVLSGAHRKAMGQFAKIATGSTISFEADSVPTWQEARMRWEDEAKGY